MKQTKTQSPSWLQQVLLLSEIIKINKQNKTKTNPFPTKSWRASFLYLFTQVSSSIALPTTKEIWIALDGLVAWWEEHGGKLN